MTWDDGMQVPGIAWWPGTIPAGRTELGLATTMDILPTSIRMAGGELPTDRVLDGHDLTGLLRGEAPSPRAEVLFYRGTRLMAIRKGPWKAHFVTQGSYVGNTQPQVHDPPLLFQLDVDPSEKWNVAERYPEVIAELKAAAESHQAAVEPVPSQLEIPLAGR